ncbi:phosphotransferase [Nonomuraea typhae]|uniref:phosphotransferase n=1 Tax=Nonomuraea typhae TaxID=2603600 RepID=UPI0012FA4E72|nr:phosphotransferase [Nonomuraea typhae]
MTRPQWEDLPAAVRDAVQEHSGPVVKAETAVGGIMPGMATILHTEPGDRFFLKAIEISDPGAILHQRERWAGLHLPEQVPAPWMVWNASFDGWHVALWDYVADAHHADLSPGSPDLPKIVDTVGRLGAWLTPPPAGARLVQSNIEPLQAKAKAMLAKPSGELADRDDYERALDGFDVAALRGNTLLHYDLSAGNLLITTKQVYVIDWAFAAQGASWIDAAMLAPRLIQAGHTPEQADTLLSGLVAWGAAPHRAVTGLAALWTLFRLYKAQHGPVEVRDDRARAAEAGKAWMGYWLSKS